MDPVTLFLELQTHHAEASARQQADVWGEGEGLRKHASLSLSMGKGGVARDRSPLAEFWGSHKDNMGGPCLNSSEVNLGLQLPASPGPQGCSQHQLPSLATEKWLQCPHPVDHLSPGPGGSRDCVAAPS